MHPLRTQYPALTGRLEGAGKPNVLGLISSDREAWECAQLFLEAGKRGGEAQGLPPATDSRSLLTADSVRDAFGRVNRESGYVATGTLLDELHRMVEDRVRRGG